MTNSVEYTILNVKYPKQFSRIIFNTLIADLRLWRWSEWSGGQHLQFVSQVDSRIDNNFRQSLLPEPMQLILFEVLLHSNNNYTVYQAAYLEFQF